MLTDFCIRCDRRAAITDFIDGVCPLCRQNGPHCIRINKTGDKVRIRDGVGKGFRLFHTRDWTEQDLDSLGALVATLQQERHPE